MGYYYIYTHMLFCVVILLTSWVGWQISQSTGNTEKVNSIFSWPYVVLLIDIFLVISYFIIIRGGEIDVNHHIQPPSAYVETFWSMVIFITYLFWDVITKLRKIEFEPAEGTQYYRKLKLSFNIPDNLF
ncbi:hypothetical protein SAMN05216490_0713 [Mucilaginibacter mallensis]|uniref:Uncharacterized protein n=1 Tax=Mucilaginibacter mallensis TaxID=652787 RepID=A0A1H1Q841_MUCMA|nr:hypothetical protein SAMN05216490_0713 [Mucilaginibacter mallensis]